MDCPGIVKTLTILLQSVTLSLCVVADEDLFFLSLRTESRATPRVWPRPTTPSPPRTPRHNHTGTGTRRDETRFGCGCELVWGERKGFKKKRVQQTTVAMMVMMVTAVGSRSHRAFIPSIHSLRLSCRLMDKDKPTIRIRRKASAARLFPRPLSPAGPPLSV